MPIQSQFENNSPPRLFINYRSTDTDQTASRLFTELERELETGQVFLDHEQIEAGQDWPERLLQEVERATVMFVLIGGAGLRNKILKQVIGGSIYLGIGYAKRLKRL